MAETRYDLELYKGSTFSIQLTARDAEGEYLDLTEYLVRGHIRYKFSDPTPLLVMTPEIDPSLVSGIINLTITEVQTSGLPVGQFPYDIEVYNLDGYVNKILKGTAFVNPEATY